jgi:hypothetical protein
MDTPRGGSCFRLLRARAFSRSSARARSFRRVAPSGLARMAIRSGTGPRRLRAGHSPAMSCGRDQRHHGRHHRAAQRPAPRAVARGPYDPAAARRPPRRPAPGRRGRGNAHVNAAVIAAGMWASRSRRLATRSRNPWAQCGVGSRPVPGLAGGSRPLAPLGGCLQCPGPPGPSVARASLLGPAPQLRDLQGSVGVCRAAVRAGLPAGGLSGPVRDPRRFLGRHPCSASASTVSAAGSSSLPVAAAVIARSAAAPPPPPLATDPGPALSRSTVRSTG